MRRAGRWSRSPTPAGQSRSNRRLQRGSRRRVKQSGLAAQARTGLESGRPNTAVSTASPSARQRRPTCVKRNPSADLRPGPAAVRRRVAPDCVLHEATPAYASATRPSGSLLPPLRSGRHVPAGSYAAPASSPLRDCVSHWAFDDRTPLRRSMGPTANPSRHRPRLTTPKTTTVRTHGPAHDVPPRPQGARRVDPPS